MAEEWPENGMDILRAILSTSAGLSVLGSLFIIISYFAFKLYKVKLDQLPFFFLVFFVASKTNFWHYSLIF